MLTKRFRLFLAGFAALFVGSSLLANYDHNRMERFLSDGLMLAAQYGEATLSPKGDKVEMRTESDGAFKPGKAGAFDILEAGPFKQIEILYQAADNLDTGEGKIFASRSKLIQKFADQIKPLIEKLEEQCKAQDTARLKALKENSRLFTKGHTIIKTRAMLTYLQELFEITGEIGRMIERAQKSGQGLTLELFAKDQHKPAQTTTSELLAKIEEVLFGRDSRWDEEGLGAPAGPPRPNQGLVSMLLKPGEESINAWSPREVSLNAGFDHRLWNVHPDFVLEKRPGLGLVKDSPEVGHEANVAEYFRDIARNLKEISQEILSQTNSGKQGASEEADVEELIKKAKKQKDGDASEHVTTSLNKKSLEDLGKINASLLKQTLDLMDFFFGEEKQGATIVETLNELQSLYQTTKIAVGLMAENEMHKHKWQNGLFYGMGNSNQSYLNFVEVNHGLLKAPNFTLSDEYQDLLGARARHFEKLENFPGLGNKTDSAVVMQELDVAARVVNGHVVHAMNCGHTAQQLAGVVTYLNHPELRLHRMLFETRQTFDYVSQIAELLKLPKIQHSQLDSFYDPSAFRCLWCETLRKIEKAGGQKLKEMFDQIIDAGQRDFMNYIQVVRYAGQDERVLGEALFLELGDLKISFESGALSWTGDAKDPLGVGFDDPKLFSKETEAVPGMDVSVTWRSENGEVNQTLAQFLGENGANFYETNMVKIRLARALQDLFIRRLVVYGLTDVEKMRTQQFASSLMPEGALHDAVTRSLYNVLMSSEQPVPVASAILRQVSTDLAASVATAAQMDPQTPLELFGVVLNQVPEDSLAQAVVSQIAQVVQDIPDADPAQVAQLVQPEIQTLLATALQTPLPEDEIVSPGARPSLAERRGRPALRPLNLDVLGELDPHRRHRRRPSSPGSPVSPDKPIEVFSREDSLDPDSYRNVFSSEPMGGQLVPYQGAGALVPVGPGGEPNYYAVLGLPYGATQQEIRTAYLAKALQNHPDRNPNYPQENAIFQAINQAYAMLSDPEAKAQYDQKLINGPQVAGLIEWPGDDPGSPTLETLARTHQRLRATNSDAADVLSAVAAVLTPGGDGTREEQNLRRSVEKLTPEDTNALAEAAPWVLELAPVPFWVQHGQFLARPGLNEIHPSPVDPVFEFGASSFPPGFGLGGATGDQGPGILDLTSTPQGDSFGHPASMQTTSQDFTPWPGSPHGSMGSSESGFGYPDGRLRSRHRRGPGSSGSSLPSEPSYSNLLNLIKTRAPELSDEAARQLAKAVMKISPKLLGMPEGALDTPESRVNHIQAQLQNTGQNLIAWTKQILAHPASLALVESVNQQLGQSTLTMGSQLAGPQAQALRDAMSLGVINGVVQAVEREPATQFTTQQLAGSQKRSAQSLWAKVRQAFNAGQFKKGSDLEQKQNLDAIQAQLRLLMELAQAEESVASTSSMRSSRSSSPFDLSMSSSNPPRENPADIYRVESSGSSAHDDGQSSGSMSSSGSSTLDSAGSTQSQPFVRRLGSQRPSSPEPAQLPDAAQFKLLELGQKISNLERDVADLSQRTRFARQDGYAFSPADPSPEEVSEIEALIMDLGSSLKKFSENLELKPTDPWSTEAPPAKDQAIANLWDESVEPLRQRASTVNRDIDLAKAAFKDKLKDMENAARANVLSQRPRPKAPGRGPRRLVSTFAARDLGLSVDRPESAPHSQSGSGFRNRSGSGSGSITSFVEPPATPRNASRPGSSGSLQASLTDSLLGQGVANSVWDGGFASGSGSQRSPQGPPQKPVTWPSDPNDPSVPKAIPFSDARVIFPAFGLGAPASREKTDYVFQGSGGQGQPRSPSPEASARGGWGRVGGVGVSDNRLRYAEGNPDDWWGQTPSPAPQESVGSPVSSAHSRASTPGPDDEVAKMVQEYKAQQKRSEAAAAAANVVDTYDFLGL